MSVVPNFAGRVALVTGASRGIGRAIALALAEAGADVAVNCRARREDAETVAAAVRKLGRRACVVVADVSRAAEVERMFAEVEKALGPVDLLVNNAGIGLRLDLDQLTEAVFDETIAVNLKSCFLCMQAAWPGMKARGYGRIVNISSAAARSAGGIGAHYNASKAGMEGLTRGYAIRLAKDGITVNAVAPALIDTEMTAPGAAARVPLGRLGAPEETAQVVVMTLANPYVTGQTIAVNGGLHLI